MKKFDFYFGAKSQPCCMSEPIVNQVLFWKLKVFSSSFGSGSHGCGLTHSNGVNLYEMENNRDILSHSKLIDYYLARMKRDKEIPT